MADEATQDAVETAVEQEQSTDVVDQSTADDAGQETTEVNWQEKFEAQKKVNRDLEKKLKGEAGTLKSQLEELQAKLEGKEAEYAEQQKTREVEAAAIAKANQRVLRADIKAEAAGKFADPADVYKFLDLESFEADANGDFDRDAISGALEDLLTSKPYLAAQGRRFTGSADGGARKEAGPKQVTRDELSRMSTDEINAARAEGRLNDLLGRK